MASKPLCQFLSLARLAPQPFPALVLGNRRACPALHPSPILVPRAPDNQGAEDYYQHLESKSSSSPPSSPDARVASERTGKTNAVFEVHVATHHPSLDEGLGGGGFAGKEANTATTVRRRRATTGSRRPTRSGRRNPRHGLRRDRALCMPTSWLRSDPFETRSLASGYFGLSFGDQAAAPSVPLSQG